MGKKIPKSRKHKKLKFVDPCYKGELPRSMKKLLSNEPPEDDDLQEVSRQTEEIIKFKNRVKANKLKRKKKKKKSFTDDFIIVKTEVDNDDTHGATKSVKYLPAVVQQKKNESQDRFFNRIQRIANTAISEAKIEQKYNIELVSVDKKGNAQYVPAEKEVSERKKEKRRKIQEKVLMKKKMRMDDSQFELKKEKISFGETVTAPPVLTVKPRKAASVEKAGKKELLLKDKFGLDKKDVSENPTPLSTKWKHMPSEKRKLVENERSRVVQMYRLLKNKKSNT